MHGLFELLLRERPEDPYGFMAFVSEGPKLSAAWLRSISGQAISAGGVQGIHEGVRMRVPTEAACMEGSIREERDVTCRDDVPCAGAFLRY